MSASDNSANNLRSPLGRARGLGSAKEGLHHWWAQRVTAVALIPLTVWFVVSIIRMANGHTEFDMWLSSPVNAAALVCSSLSPSITACSACRWCWRIMFPVTARGWCR